MANSWLKLSELKNKTKKWMFGSRSKTLLVDDLKLKRNKKQKQTNSGSKYEGTY